MVEKRDEQIADISKQRNLTAAHIVGYSAYAPLSMLGSILWSFRNMYYALIGMNMNLLSTAQMIARLIDLVVALMVGGIIEKVRLKIGGGGKYRPWLLIFMIAITISIIISFIDFAPGNDAVHFVVVTIGALGVAVSMSFIGACQFGLVPLMAGASAVDRTNLTTWNYRISTIAQIFNSLTAAYLLTWFGNFFAPPMNYTVMASGFAGFYLVGGAILRATAKPFDKPTEAVPGAAPPQVKVADMVKAVTTNSQLLIYLTAQMLSMIGMLVNMNIVIYFWQLIIPYTHGIAANVSFPGYYTVGQTTNTVANFIFAMFAPEIGKRLGKKNAMWIGLLGAAGTSGVLYFLGAGNWMVWIGLNMFMMFCGALYAGFGINYALDCGEYGLWKTGEDHRLVIMSMNNLPMKIAGIVAGFVMYALAGIGFDSLEVRAASAQGVLPAFVDDKFVTSFMLLLVGIPAVCRLVASMMMLFLYKIKDEDSRVYAAENQKRREEAAAAKKAAEEEAAAPA